MPPTPIPPFLLPRGLPTARTLRTLHHNRIGINTTSRTSAHCFSSTAPTSKSKKDDRHQTLGQPDKFRPPSHPQRLVNATRTSPSGQPVNYGPRLTAEQREAQKRKQYPNMFPPEGTVMFKFLTSRWIHIWIAMVRIFDNHIPVNIQYPKIPSDLIPLYQLQITTLPSTQRPKS